MSDLPSKDISSTNIRKLISTASYNQLKDIINKKVLDYIIENNLYGG